MISPIVRRELSVRARNRATAWIRVGAAVISVALAGATLISVTGATRPGEVGRTLFLILAWIGFLFCLVEGPRLAADSISEEKRAGTLGLLFLTDLRGYDVIFGKLAATGLGSLYTLLATFPGLALPLLLGGVTGGEFWRIVLSLTITLLLSFAVSLWSSVLCTKFLNALIGAASLLALVLLVPLMLSMGFGWDLLRASPYLAFQASFDGPYRAAPGFFWSSILQLCGVAALFLGAAAWSLPRTWHQTLSGRSASPWVRSLANAIRPPAWWLQKDPVYWQATRDPLAALTCRGVAALVLVAATAILAFCPPGRLAAGGLDVGILIAMGVLHVVLCIWIAAAASQLLWKDRDTGALELLLSTPLPVVTIVEGYARVLRWTFVWPILTIVIVEAFLAVHLLVAHLGFVPWPLLAVPMVLGAGVVISEYYALGWYGLWCGLTARKLGRALAETLLFVLFLPLLALLGCAPVWMGGALVKNLVFITFSKTRLFEDLRRRAAEPILDRKARSPRRDRGRLPEVLPNGLAR